MSLETDILSKYSKGKISFSLWIHSSSLRACAEQQQNCFSVCSQRVKHVVLRSSREHTTEQIIMIQNSIACWTRAISPPSVYCPRTGRHWSVCVQDTFLRVYFTRLFYIWGAILSALCFHTLQHYQHYLCERKSFHMPYHTQKCFYKSQYEPWKVYNPQSNNSQFEEYTKPS